MKNTEFLYCKNDGAIKISHLKGTTIEYISNAKVLNFHELNNIIKFLRVADKKFGNSKFIKYYICFKNQLQVIDKLTYILLECLLYDQIVNKGKSIIVDIQKYKNKIQSEGIIYSCIRLSGNPDEFKNKFFKDISKYHYRRVITYEMWNNKMEIISIIMSDIKQFLVTCNVDQEQANQAAEISVELLDNALEHSESDGLIDIDVSQYPYYKDNNLNEPCIAVNIAVVDFSEKILGNGIKDKILVVNSSNEAYNRLKDINRKHKMFFNDKYGEEQFYMMAAFQNKISTRNDNNCTGGNGLTKLIEGLQESSVSDICYVVSNDNCLYFIKDNIKQDANKWVGFNKENNIELPPDEKTFAKSPIKIYGTAYNLTFIFRRNDND